MPALSGKVGSVGFVGFLVDGTSACVLMNEGGSCLSVGQVHILLCVLGCLGPYYDFRQLTANGWRVLLSCSLFGIGFPAL